MTSFVLRLAVALAGTLAIAPAAHATPGDGVLSILTMGDSYSAGNGAGEYSGAKGCYRSNGNYGSRYAKLLESAPYNQTTRETTVACSGDTTSAVESGRNGRPPQIKALSDDHDLVLLTIAGNDLKFAKIVQYCLIAKTRDGANCGSLLTQAEEALDNGTIRTRLTNVLTAIRDKADPAAQIVLLGYPYLEGDTGYTLRSGHGGNTFIDVGKRLRAIQDEGEAIQADVVSSLAKAGAAQLVFVSTRSMFDGPPIHTLYAKKNNANRWFVQPFVDASIVTKSTWYHPNSTGWQREADLLVKDARVIKRDPQISASSAAQPPVMLVVDISGSMGDDDGQGVTKIDGAKTALLDFVGGAEPSSRMGLWTYPDQSGSGCNSGAKVLPIANVDPAAMGSAIRKLQPDGDTPTAEAMRAAAGEITADNARNGTKGGTLVIVSDGESTCADPCDVAKELAGKGLDLETITVGFNISDAGRKQLQCISGALSGRYLDIHDSDQLGETLNRLARPQLQVSLGTASITAVAGGDYADVPVKITNNGEVEAQDVLGQLYAGSDSQAAPTSGFDVRRPIVHLGNLAPHATIDVTWQVRAGGERAGNSTAFTIQARAANASTAGGAGGRITATGVTTFAQVGRILKGPGAKIAILGDSFSAGEGAGDYDTETNDSKDGCHRTDNTYLIPAAGAGKVELLACSGAKSQAIWTTNERNRTEGAQSDRLAALDGKNGGIRAVVMTMGGNDVDFGPLTASCLIGPRSCAKRVYLNVLPKAGAWLSTDDFVSSRLGPNSSLESSLETVYISVNRALNNADSVKRRGAVAPILVLAYPFLLPYQEPACAPMGYVRSSDPSLIGPNASYLLSADEVAFAADFEAKLNGVVETAIDSARRNDGVPVFFIPATELAFMPRHSLCDAGSAGSSTEPFGRTLGTVIPNPVAFDHETSIAAQLASVGLRTRQQLAHPTATGYKHETYALLRWSVSKDADAAVRFLATAKPAPPPPKVADTWPQSDVVLGPGTQTVQTSTSYPLAANGFDPQSSVQLTIHSAPRLLGSATADGRGNVRTRVAIPPDMPKGRHTIEVTGSARGRLRTVRIRVNVAGPFRPPLQAAIGVGSAVALLLGLLLTALTGRLNAWRARLG